MAIQKINPEDYTYHLPAERIASYPLEQRDASKLLHYQKGKIEDRVFKELAELLPKDSLLFFNNTRVIPARLHFFRDTGAHIEILLDKAHSPSRDPLHCVSQTEQCKWTCIIGNKKKWREGEKLVLKIDFEKENIHLEAELEDKEQNLVKFTWNGGSSFSKVLEGAGHTPLPPYIKREDEDSDKESYQTVYAKIKGAVAAPTAGLHFTERVLKGLEEKGIRKDELTLHVGAGTFMPIKVKNAADHNMHSELLHVKKSNIINILDHSGPIIPVGTTAMRSLESLYWFGLKLEKEDPELFETDKDFPYQDHKPLGYKKAMENILSWMDKKQLEELSGDTSIFIYPGYDFRVCKGIITNFHQPGTTLILLIAALIGEDWRKVYDHALKNDYRFLSYGDSSLLIP